MKKSAAKKSSYKKNEYHLIGKVIFFPKKEILAIGDLHIGYESMLNNQGIDIQFNQLENTKKELKETIKEINGLGHKIKKIIFLGDIKHYFSFDKAETFQIKQFLKFLEEYFKKEDIIFIKGNHDVIRISGKKYHDYWIDPSGEIAFTHGDKLHKEILDKKIRTIVIGHIHPAVTLKEPSGIKKERFKVFLIGRWKNKQLIIVPSFFPLIEGIEINEFYQDFHKKDFSIIQNRSIGNFKVFIVGEKSIYEFGKFKDI